jgi:SAM-dependent methyltransferase
MQGLVRSLYQRGFAWGLAAAGDAYERLVAERKRALLAPLGGTVLEIGPGTGTNLAYFAPGIRWLGIEPNPYMERYLQREAERLGRAIEVRGGTAERLDLMDASVDAVVSTLVLCSVRDQARALAEVRRVLKPGGRFVFLEHVAAPRGSWLRRAQRAVRPLWRLLGDGCFPDRETWQAIGRAGFAEVRLDRFQLPLPIMAPHIGGWAVR